MRLVEATRGIVTAADLSRMKPTGVDCEYASCALIASGALVARGGGTAGDGGG